MSKPRILVINPGSTSTKIAVFEDEEAIFTEVLRHSPEELAPYKHVADQYEFRKQLILAALEKNNIPLSGLNAVVGRGGLIKPVPSGTFIINEQMLDDLRNLVRGVEHASNLAAIIAYEIGKKCNIPAYIVDPVAVDEFEPIARVTGLAEIERESMFHALNQKAIARRAARDLGKKYEELNLVITHMGGGVSVAAHRHGKVIDVDGGPGSGPMAPERAGGLPGDKLIKMCFSGKYDEATMMKKLVGKGGLMSLLGTSDTREVEKRIANGDEKAKLAYEAMAYKIAKEIGAMATVLKGKVDAIIMTGGIAYSEMFTGWIKERVSFIAPVMIYPGEDEMLALVQGGLRVLRGEEQPKEYV